MAHKAVRAIVFGGVLAWLLGSSAIAAPSPAAKSAPIHVVKIISFDCPVCYQSETLDPPLRQAVLDQGGQFVIAPIPRAESQSRERFYYALRELGPAIELKARQSLFRGTQELNYPLSDAPQTLDWLSQDLSSENIDWDRIVATVNSDKGAQPVQRVIDLAFKAGAQITPTYVLVRDGVVLATFDINSAANPSLSALREAVLTALKTATTKAKR